MIISKIMSSAVPVIILLIVVYLFRRKKALLESLSDSGVEAKAEVIGSRMRSITKDAKQGIILQYQITTLNGKKVPQTSLIIPDVAEGEYSVGNIINVLYLPDNPNVNCPKDKVDKVASLLASGLNRSMMATAFIFIVVLYKLFSAHLN